MNSLILTKEEAIKQGFVFVNNMIINYFGNSQDIIIPFSIGEENITIIGENAFNDKHLTSLSIPVGIKTIKFKAFANNCLESLILPNSIKSIEKGAFYNNSLTSVDIPNSVKIIKSLAFAENLLNVAHIPRYIKMINIYSFDNHTNLIRKL